MWLWYGCFDFGSVVCFWFVVVFFLCLWFGWCDLCLCMLLVVRLDEFFVGVEHLIEGLRVFFMAGIPSYTGFVDC